MNTSRIPLRGVAALFSMYRGLPGSIYALFFARLVNAAGSFIFPFLTLFLTERLGYTASHAGLFIFLLSVSSIPGAFVGGRLADFFGRRRVLLVTQALAAACFVPCGFLLASPVTPWLILAGNFFLASVRPCQQAIVTDLTSAGTRQAGFSLLYLGNNIGFALGPLLAGFLYRNAAAWIFWGNALAMYGSLLFVLMFVPETLPCRGDAAGPAQKDVRDAVRSRADAAGAAPAHGCPDDTAYGERPAFGSTLAALFERPFLLGFIALSVLSGFVYSQHSFTLPLQLHDLFGADGATLFGFVMSANAIVVVALTAPLIALTRRFDPVVNQGLAAVLYAAGFGMLAFVRAVPLYMLSTAVWTAGEILSATNMNVYIASHTPVTHRGRFNAVIPVVTSVGSSSGPLFMGGVIGLIPISSVWLVVSILGTAAAAGFFLLGRAERSAASRVSAPPVAGAA